MGGSQPAADKATGAFEIEQEYDRPVLRSFARRMQVAGTKLAFWGVVPDRFMRFSWGNLERSFFGNASAHHTFIYATPLILCGPTRAGPCAHAITRLRGAWVENLPGCKRGLFLPRGRSSFPWDASRPVHTSRFCHLSSTKTRGVNQVGCQSGHGYHGGSEPTEGRGAVKAELLFTRGLPVGLATCGAGLGALGKAHGIMQGLGRGVVTALVPDFGAHLADGCRVAWQIVVCSSRKLSVR